MRKRTGTSKAKTKMRKPRREKRKVVARRAKPAARKPKAIATRKRTAPARKAAARVKKAAPKRPVPRRRTVKAAEKRSRTVQRLLALKAKKAEKTQPRREGFLIRAPKKARQERLTTPPHFVRRPPPAPALPPAKVEGKPAKSVLRKRDLDELRSALTAERQHLIVELAALDETASLTGPSEVNENVPGYSIHPAEYASDNQVMETTLAQRALLAERLAEIEEALQRINNPGYGICQNCDKPISLERLKVKPSAQFCVPCRQLKEQGRL